MSEAATEPVDNDSLVGLLNQLAEVPDPAPVSMVPQTAGWAVLGVLLLLAAGWRAHRLWQQHKANAYRRAALRALAGTGDDPAQILAVLKRAALVAYGRKNVASLSGKRWLAFLDATADGLGFEGKAAIATATYQTAPPARDPDLAKMAQQWIKTHRAPEGGDA